MRLLFKHPKFQADAGKAVVDTDKESADWCSLNYERKNRQIFLRQKETLDMFLEHGAISEAQHDKSLQDLIEKMRMAAEVDADARQV